MNLTSLPLLVLVLAGQAAPQDADKAAAAARLDFIRDSLKVLHVQRGDDPSVTYRLQLEPVLRFTNVVGTVKDGAIFLWTGEGGRPEAAVQVFWHNNGNWFQEFSSLSLRPIAARDVWKVGRRGLDLNPIPGAPRPADTSEQRLRQIRSLVGAFTAEEQFERKTWQKLRLLTKPFARYGKPDSDVSDGALFAYVLTTDPEVYLVIEARPGPDGPEWQYGFAPASIDPLRVSWKNREVWSLPYREAWTDNSAPFYVHFFHRGLAKTPRAGSQ
ncbi:MAG: hypothetical protein P4L84_20995 [Isosphaeraceae bacterium]|nr:hypothetical protein [Isosphaeraceae bacterium]